MSRAGNGSSAASMMKGTKSSSPGPMQISSRRNSGPRLTGRYTKITLFPFSFREFLQFSSIGTNRITVKKKAQVLAGFDRYLSGGGFPDYLKSGDPEYLKRIYDDILFRDIISRFGIREVKGFRQLAQYLVTNTAKPGDL
jgi:predicted AAA+ superfamily ATPase